MKKIILFFVTVALAGGIQSAYAQGSFKSAETAVAEAESIIRTFSGDHDADVVSIGWMPMKFMKMIIDDHEAKQILKMVKGLLIIDLEDCSADVKSRFSLRMGKYIDSLGELKLMEARDGEDNVIVIGDESSISGMLVYGKDGEVVLLKLSAKPETLGKLIKAVS